MELLLALPVGHAVPEGCPVTAAHMAYRVGPGPRLLGIRIPEGPLGGLMYLDCAGFEGGGDCAPCASQIMGECRRRGFRGVVCDFEGPPLPCLAQLISALDRGCGKEGWTLLVPEAYAPHAPSAQVLVSSAVTSGSLERRLLAARERWGAARPVLAAEWLREDFLLPAEGRGEPVSRAALEDQIRRLQPAIFFDRGMCAHYYTYMVPGGQAHFVLFDTVRSLRAKLAVARRLELPAVLLAEPEVGPCLREVLEGN